MLVILHNPNTNGFAFECKEELNLREYTAYCPICNLTIIAARYQYIIEKLKDSGLLDKDYELRCCLCLK